LLFAVLCPVFPGITFSNLQRRGLVHFDFHSVADKIELIDDNGVGSECIKEKTQRIQQNTAEHVVPHSTFNDSGEKKSRSHDGLP
jgi:hypothetical protein